MLEYFMSEEINPPVAKKDTKITKIHGVELKDDYFWLRFKENKEVIEYLKAENEYTKSKTKNLESFVDELFTEMKNRIKEDDESVPYKFKDYFYYTRNEKNKEYKIYCRKHKNLETEEEIILDLNEIAEELEYCKLQTFRISPNQKLLAFSLDVTGYEKFVIYIKNLETGDIFKEGVENIGWDFEWADDKTIYYSLRDDAQRPYALKRHILETKAKEDIIIFEEKDTKRELIIKKSKDQKYLFVKSYSTTSSEIRFLDLNNPLGDFVVFLPREEKHEYEITHKNGYFYIVTNTDESTNFKLMKTAVNQLEKENWEEIITHSKNIRILWTEAFENFIAIHIREEVLHKVHIFFGKNDDRNHTIKLPEQIYRARSGDNYEYFTDVFRLNYSSLITPNSVYDYEVNERKLLLRKEEEIKDYIKEDYITERKFVSARDGVKIPISVVYKKGIKTPAPTLLHGYGSYGSSEDPKFSPINLSLIERGMIYVIAHVRGGGELGKPWYEDGKLLKKMNTFYDFIDCAEHLIREGVTTKDLLIAEGRSAGGLLMGAIVNMRPDLFYLILAGVPFVDVINTMLDESIPLTSEEWEEWGDPREKEYFEYMLSYSPYDNISAKDYPNILVTAGLNDPRVHYWEPAKFVAKLRELNTGNNDLLLKTNLGAGHSGASGRYESMKEKAFMFGYALDKVGLAHK
jgi:oligopeptidase B